MQKRYELNLKFIQNSQKMMILIKKKKISFEIIDNE
jgi:hypothetical protein